jgi:hypothetical protein
LAAAAEADEAAAAEAAAAAEDDAAVSGAGVGVVVVALLDVVPLVEDDVGDGVTVDTPLTFTAGIGVTVALVMELVADVLVVLVLLFAMDIVWVAEELVLVEDKGIVVVVVFGKFADDPFAQPPPELPLVASADSFNVKIHFFTSCTSDIPFAITGVKVISHVSVAGPIGVFICVTVVAVVGSETARSFGRCCEVSYCVGQDGAERAARLSDSKTS